MVEPENSEAIILARNKLGDLVREENHSGVYQHEYDALSNLSATTFPDGRELKFLRYGTGHLLEMPLSLSGKTLPVTGYRRYRLHRETHRTMGALELETHYDMAGRITHRRCTDNLRDRLVSERRYQWDRADQIIRRMYTDGDAGFTKAYRRIIMLRQKMHWTTLYIVKACQAVIIRLT